MRPDDDACYAAVSIRDRRYDGWFFVGVTTTGIYCRPSCPAGPAKREHLRFFATSAAAQAQGYRACRRCRPDAAPGSPAYDHAGSVAAAAVRLIDDGYVQRHGVAGLASRLGYSTRQLGRILSAEVGAGPLQLDRARRAHAARVLIQTTSLPFTDVAFAAGFGSVRQFNDTLREVFASSPSQLRTVRHSDTRDRRAEATTITLRLAHREPFDHRELWRHLGLHAVPGVQEMAGETFRQVLTLPHRPAIVELTPGAGHVRAVLHLQDLRDLTAAVAACRRQLDLDADPVGREQVLADADPTLAALVREFPGLRVPGSSDLFATAAGTVLGQQVTLAAAARLGGLLAAQRGTPVTDHFGGLTHAYPTADQVAHEPLALPMPASRNRTLDLLAAAVATGAIRLDVGTDAAEAAEALQELPGIGRWTTDYIRLRALGDPDVYASGDLALRRSAEQIAGFPASPREQDRAAQRWSPVRSLASQFLWTHATRNRTR